MTIFGVDISNNNGVVDVARLKAEGFDFVWAKVSEGSGFRDTYWPATRDRCRDEGLIVAGYHYVKTDDPNRQADTFVAQLGDKSVPAMLDFELNSGGIGNFWAVLNAVEARGVHVALSYIPRWYWQGYMGSCDLSGVPGLIQSNYVSGTGPASLLYPGDDSVKWAGFGNRHVDVLQFTDKAVAAGKRLDANAFRGTPDQLRQLLGTQAAPVANAIDEQYAATPWLGARLTGELPTPDGRGRFSAFEHGHIDWTPTTGARPVPERLFEAYAELGYEAGPLGYPSAYHTVLPDGDVQAFERGVLYRKYGRPGFYVTGSIGDRYRREGYEAGPLGWPVSNEERKPGLVYQAFEHGVLAWSPDSTVALKAPADYPFL